MQIAVGLMRINNLTEDELYNFILKCLDLGITKFDIADIYGREANETKLGKVLLKHSELRNKMYLQSKVGINFHECGYDSSYDYLLNATDKCLKRLNTTYLDNLLIHRPDLLMDNQEVALAIDKLQKEKKIIDFGVSNFNTSEIAYLQQTLKTPIKLNQVHLSLGNTAMLDSAMYTNMVGVNHSDDNLLFFLKKNKISIECWSPYQLPNKAGSIFDEEKAPQIYLTLKKYSEIYHTSMCAIATAFLCRIDPTLTVVTGSTNLNHIKESIEGSKIILSKGEWYQIYKDCGVKLP